MRSLRAGFSAIVCVLAVAAQEPVVVRHSRLSESSGVARSVRNPGLYWTLNDSGNDAELFAFDLKGVLAGVWKVPGAANQDWEDLAIGPGPDPKLSYLYIGDIGDNGRQRRSVSVYRVAEPVRPKSKKKSAAGAAWSTGRAERLDFVYPDGAHDAESLLVHPKTGDLYIVIKTRRAESVAVYKATAPFVAGAEPVKLAWVATLSLPNNDSLGNMLGRITGGAINGAGDRVALCGYAGGYESVLAKGAKFEDVFAGPWVAIELPKRNQGEAITYMPDGLGLVMTSEGKPMPVHVLDRK